MAVPYAGIKVLIVEDDAEARQSYRHMLGALGITQVFLSSDGRQGMAFMDIELNDCDLVMCDWNMPKMTGVELLRQLRSVNPDVPFLMVTGRADAESVLEAKASGVTAYIRKPFSMNELRLKLDKIFLKSDKKDMIPKE